MQSTILSIITITFNNLEGLKKTVDSVKIQGFKDYEHIIIDGNSTDGSIEWLKNYTGHPLAVYSDQDEGIYDAMNKGIAKVMGRWVIFLNAGDRLADDNTLEKVDFSIQSDLMFGDSIIQYQNGFSRISKAGSLNALWKGMSFTHQSIFVQSALVKTHPFDLKWKYSADFEQIYTFHTTGKRFTYLDFVVSEIEAGGVSDAKRYKASREVYRINRKLGAHWFIHPYFIFKIAWGFIVVKVKSLLPKKWAQGLVKLKYK